MATHAARRRATCRSASRPTTAPCRRSTSSRSRSTSGEVLGIVGESGCGKTREPDELAARLLPPTAIVDRQRAVRRQRPAGSVECAAPADPRPRDRVRLPGADDVAEPRPSRVGRQIGEVLQRHLGCSRRARARRRAVELLDLVRIPAPVRGCDEYPHQLSGGMRQRVMIAIALACDPKMLIADEPTTALDVTIQAGILDLMRDIRDRLGTAIVLITHNLGVVADIADRVIVMYAGRKVEEAPVARAVRHPQHPYTIGLLGAIPRPGGVRRRLQEIPGRVPGWPSRCRPAPSPTRCPRADSRSRSEVPQLREVRPSHLVACFHPGTRMTAADRRSSRSKASSSTSTSARSSSGGGGIVHAVDGVSLTIGPGELARPGRRVRQRQVDGRQLHRAARSSRPPGRSASSAPTSRTSRGARCARCAARCTWSSRIRTRRSTRG